MLNDGLRRMIDHAGPWAARLEAAIRPRSDVRLVSPCQPSPFSFGGQRKGVRPADLAGRHSPIPAAGQR